MSTRESMADAYIVVLDVTADSVRALLFDSEARRVEGFAAQLPRRADAAADCLDEMHRLVRESGFRVRAIVGRAENEVTEEDRSLWTAFNGATWLPALPEGAGTMLGCGCVSREFLALTMDRKSTLSTVVESPVEADGLSCARIDEHRWMLSGEAPFDYLAFKRAIRGSVDNFLEHAADGDPLIDQLESAARSLRKIYDKLAGFAPAPQVIAALKSPSLAQRLSDTLGVPLNLSTEMEPTCRGAALWALEQTGAIENLAALPASLLCFNLKTTK